MDPTTCLHDALHAFATGQRQRATEHLSDLVHWLETGGFRPSVLEGDTNHRDVFTIPSSTRRAEADRCEHTSTTRLIYQVSVCDSCGEVLP